MNKEFTFRVYNIQISENTEGFFVFKNELFINFKKRFLQGYHQNLSNIKIFPSASSNPFLIASDWPLSLPTDKCEI